MTLDSDSRRTASSCSAALPVDHGVDGAVEAHPGREAEALAGVDRQLQHAGPEPAADDGSVWRSKIVVRMSLMTLSSSATISRRRPAGDVGARGQHGASAACPPRRPAG